MDNKSDMIKQEYEEFAYIVSHDLCAPLRRLREFGNLFFEEHKDDLSEKDRLYLHFMQSSISNLEEMQNALLTFSRINTRANPFVEVNCNRLIDKVITDLSPFCENVSFDFKNLPTVIADEEQLYMVFYHLLDNARKFHKDGEKVECQISGDDRIDHFMLTIKDNGFGIPSKFHEEVFKIFKKLDESDKYKGVGAGLALTRKIINRHNGQIWIDSEPEMGTTVLFTLPK